MSLRIVRVRYKLLYLAVWLGVTLLLAVSVFALLPAVPKAIAAQVVFLAFVVVAVRSFRGASELVEPPRAWWRMTGTVRSGIVLSALLTIDAASDILSIAGWPRPVAQAPRGLFAVTLDLVVNLLLAALYVNSAVRLHRSPDPVAQKPVELAQPLKSLD